MSSSRRIALATLIEVAAILGVHQVLLFLLAERGVVASLLSAGGHLPVGSLLLALAFVAVRLLACVGIPGFVLYRLVLLGCALLATRTEQASGDDRVVGGPPRPGVN